jgi:hypothetical protein
VITAERQKEFMARTLVGMVMYKQREFTDEECAVYNSILALIEAAGAARPKQSTKPKNPTAPAVENTP